MTLGATLRNISLAMVVLALGATPAFAGKKDKAQSAQAAQPVPPESFSYFPASDRNLRVTVNSVVLHGQPEFIPKAANWIQINVTVANIGRRTLNVGSIQGKLSSGMLFAGARGFENILREPTASEIVGSSYAQAGVGAAASLFIFPPAGIIVGMAGMAKDLIGMGKRERRQQRYQESLFTVGPIAPGTSIGGNVYLPALRGQDGMIVFYTLAGSDESLEVRRMPVVPAPVPAAVGNPRTANR